MFCRDPVRDASFLWANCGTDTRETWITCVEVKLPDQEHSNRSAAPVLMRPSGTTEEANLGLNRITQPV